jgi:hypothetical protein
MLFFENTRGFGAKVPAILLLMFLSLSALGQVSVGVKCNNTKYIEGEDIIAQIRVRNNTGVPLVFNEKYHNAEIKVCVGCSHDVNCIPIEKDINHDFVILPDDTVTELVSLKSLIGLHKPGVYQIKGRVVYNGKTFTSRGFGFDIVKGIELVSRKRVLRDYPDVVLTYSLRYLGRESREYAFLVITDEDRGIIYGTFNLGRILRVYPPVLKFDNNDRIECIHQSGHKRYTRSVISVNRDGAKFEKQTNHKPSGEKYYK